jgi:hypothetical protein
LTKNKRIGLEQWLSTKGDIVPRGHVATSGETFAYHEWAILYKSSGKRPRMPLNILSYIRQLPRKINYSTQNVKSARGLVRVKKRQHLNRTE